MDESKENFSEDNEVQNKITNNEDDKQNNKHVKKLKKINKYKGNNKSKKKGNKYIKKENIIDEFFIDKYFNFDRFNLSYSWEDADFVTDYAKKRITDNYIYLACTKRGNSGKNCPGKAKFEIKTGKIIIYEKCNNINSIHFIMDLINLKHYTFLMNLQI